MKKSLYFLFILALFCLTGCKDALVPKPIKLTCNINTFFSYIMYQPFDSRCG